MYDTIPNFVSWFNTTKKRKSWYTNFVVVTYSNHHKHEEFITKPFYLHKYDSCMLTKVSCTIIGRRVTYKLHVK